MTNPDNVGGLLPCPFCGGAPKVESSFGSWSVSCICGVTGPRVGKGMDYDEERAMVITVWNQRAELCRAAPAGGESWRTPCRSPHCANAGTDHDYCTPVSAPAGSGEVSRLELARMELAVTAALFNYSGESSMHKNLQATAALLRKLQQGAE